MHLPRTRAIRRTICAPALNAGTHTRNTRETGSAAPESRAARRTERVPKGRFMPKNDWRTNRGTGRESPCETPMRNDSIMPGPATAYEPCAYGAMTKHDTS